MSDDASNHRATSAAIACFAVIAMLILWDLLQDYGQGVTRFHLITELVVLLAAAAGVGVLWRTLHRASTDLAEARVEAERWRRESRDLIRGLSVAIENQFSRWALTTAESEVGLLLLKGLSHKEIAAIRSTSERTVREQARSLYRKSGLSGRSALSAFFLEDLLLGQEEAETDGASEDSRAVP